MSPAIETEGMRKARQRRKEFKDLEDKTLHFYNSKPSKEAHNHMVELCKAATKKLHEEQDYSTGLQEAVQELSERLEAADLREDEIDKAYQSLDHVFQDQQKELEGYGFYNRRFKKSKISEGAKFTLCLLGTVLTAYAIYTGFKMYKNISQPDVNRVEQKE